MGKKKSDKKKKKDGCESEISSIPSKVEMDNDCESQGSMTMNDDSFPGRKKKTKEKQKKTKQKKTKNNFPEFPADDFGDGLEGLAEEFRRSKEKYGEEKTKESLSEYSSVEVPNMKENSENDINNMFESAWNDMEKSSNGELRHPQSIGNDEKQNSFTGENTENPFGNEKTEVDVKQKVIDYEARVYEAKVPDTSDQQEEILKLQ